MKRALLLCLLSLITFSLYAGPFGLEKGMSMEQVKLVCDGREPEALSDDQYIIFPQKTHPYFVTYIAWISETEGLYYLKAIGSDLETSKYGTSLKAKFESIEQSLSKTYGMPSRIDELHSESFWVKPDDWMFALAQGDRYFFDVWEKDNESSLPETITAILLCAEAKSTTCGFITLEYEFENYERVQKLEDSVF
jgi:hypothetical protein